jgi:adenylate cyclase class 2
MSSESTIEIEIKATIPSIDDMTARLEAEGATFEATLDHEDAYYDLPEKMGTFAATDEALRVRSSKNATEGIEKAFITYKGPKLDASTKTRTEIEVGIDDSIKAKAMLEALHYRLVIAVRKHRRLYRLDGIEITLDEVEHLDGAFMELEIMGDTSNADEGKERLFTTIERLGVSRDDCERKSYLELILEHLA